VMEQDIKPYHATVPLMPRIDSSPPTKFKNSSSGFFHSLKGGGGGRVLYILFSAF